jgi:hypothetical protein
MCCFCIIFSALELAKLLMATKINIFFHRYYTYTKLKPPFIRCWQRCRYQKRKTICLLHLAKRVGPCSISDPNPDCIRIRLLIKIGFSGVSAFGSVTLVSRQPFQSYDNTFLLEKDRYGQCCGSMTFWGGSGSGSPDPCL